MTYSEWWEIFKSTPGCGVRWMIPWSLPSSPAQTVLAVTSDFSETEKCHEMANVWPGIVLHIPAATLTDADCIAARMADYDSRAAGGDAEDGPAEREAAPGFMHKRPTAQRSILDAEHWEGTPNHVRYTLGCQMDKLQDVSANNDGLLSAEELVALTDAMCKIGRVLYPVWREEGFSEDVRDWDDFE